MMTNDFKSIVTTFADPKTEILFEKDRIVIQVNGDLIDAIIKLKSGDVYVDEGGGLLPASKWVITRLAHIPLLASRIRETVSSTDYFVSPSANALQTIAKDSCEKSEKTNDALNRALELIGDKSPLETMVYYVTSDAGEGKTFLINELARIQAKRYAENHADWLLLPIPLGGRHFLRFDDITIGALQNRYRFPFLYYNSLLELIKMGVIVPAFDGFEEMFVESSTGEALSAMGILVGSLDSKGTVVVATRKAYFEFENLKTQEKLFDTIRNFSVGFAKIELNRWAKVQFTKYGSIRGVQDIENLYQSVSERLGSEHPLLTRAILVRRLIDLALQSLSLDSLLERIQKSGADFFSVFVRGIIEREANEKWIDRSGKNEIGSPLLNVDEHCELLSNIALSMWEARVDYLKRDLLEFVVDYFCETNEKSAFYAKQIRERIRGHALLISSPNANQAIEFDHDDFRLFFLGEGVAKQLRPLNDRAKAEVLGVFRRGLLPRQAQHALIGAISRDPRIDRIQVVKFLLEIGGMDTQASYTQENCSDLIIRLLSGVSCAELVVNGIAFGPNAIRDRKLHGVIFRGCYFSPTSVETTTLTSCKFESCKFEQLRVYESTKFVDVIFDSSNVDSLLLSEKHRELWEPIEIQNLLQQLGVKYSTLLECNENTTVTEVENDDDLRDTEKLARYFMRSTHMSESVMLMKLGTRGQTFIDKTLPILIKHGVMTQIENHGGGDQRRFRLGVPLKYLHEAVVSAHGSFQRFLEIMGKSFER